MPGPTEPADRGPAAGDGGARPSRWRDLLPRVASALILAPLALLCIWLGGLAWALLLVAAALGLGCEWAWVCGARLWGAGGLLPAAAVLAVALAAAGAWIAAFAVLCVAGAGVLLATRGHAVLLAAGVPCIGAASLALLWLRGAGGAGGMGAVLLLILVVWASDIGAYAVGRLVGGAKLAPRISPGKTWSGAVGGLVCAMLAGFAVAASLSGPGAALAGALVGGVLGMVSQGGDLAESALKRRFGRKDSGRLIPGHGGLLDRLDGVLAAAPVAAVLALIARQGLLF